MKHEKGFGCFMVHKNGGVKDLERLKMKHEKGFGCFSLHGSQASKNICITFTNTPCRRTTSGC